MLIHRISLKRLIWLIYNLKLINSGIDKLKNVTSGLSSLKSKVDKLDIDKLVPAPVDLSKLSDVVKCCLKRCI